MGLSWIVRDDWEVFGAGQTLGFIDRSGFIEVTGGAKRGGVWVGIGEENLVFHEMFSAFIIIDSRVNFGNICLHDRKIRKHSYALPQKYKVLVKTVRLNVELNWNILEASTAVLFDYQ